MTRRRALPRPVSLSHFEGNCEISKGGELLPRVPDPETKLDASAVSAGGFLR